MDGSGRPLSVPSLSRIVEDPFVGDEGGPRGTMSLTVQAPTPVLRIERGADL